MSAITTSDVQRLLTAAGYYKGDIDGDLGPKTQTGIAIVLRNRTAELPTGWDAWPWSRKSIAALQLILKHAGYPAVGKIDGFAGMMTKYALGRYDQFILTGKRPAVDWRPDETPTAPNPAPKPAQIMSWPAQSAMEKFYGKAGGPQCTAGKVELPFEMRIAWDLTDTIRSFSCHEKVADSATRVYARIASAYSAEDIRKHGFDLFGGCYNYRVKRGGSSLSTHAYGAAIDHDPERNQLKWGKDRAYLAKPECVEFFRCWEAEGWLSLGRRSNFDWMHVQAARY